MKRHFLPADCPPRSPNLTEEEALTQYYEEQGMDRSDAQNMLEVNHIAVYDDCARFLPNHSGTVLVLLSTREVEVFVYDNATETVTLVQEFRSVTMEEITKAHPAISEGETV